MNAIDFLMQEHRNAKEKFQEIENASPDRRGELWTELEPELKVHEHVENEFLYGPLSRDPQAKGTPLADFQKHQDEDVAELESKMKDLASMDATSDRWLDMVQQIHAALADHIREEETEILPRIPSVWTRERIDDAGNGMADEKERKLREVKGAA